MRHIGKCSKQNNVYNIFNGLLVLNSKMFNLEVIRAFARQYILRHISCESSPMYSLNQNHEILFVADETQLFFLFAFVA